MPKYNPDIHRRRSIRLKHHDYRQAGWYFVTICCKDKQCLFGSIHQNIIQLNDLGLIAQQSWQKIPLFYPQVILHDFIIMPNHLHGVIEITECTLPKQPYPANFHGTSQSIGAMVRGFKSSVTSWARQHEIIYDVWQRNYHEHIIRDEAAYLHISAYIQNNAMTWTNDCFYNDNPSRNTDAN